MIRKDFLKWYEKKEREHNKKKKQRKRRDEIVLPNFLTGKGKEKRDRKKVSEQERHSAEILKKISGKGYIQPASGSIDIFKGDSVSDKEMCECKQTSKEKISLKLEWIRKLDRERSFLAPLLNIRFVFGRREYFDFWLGPKWFFKKKINEYVTKRIDIEGRSKTLYFEEIRKENVIHLNWRRQKGRQESQWFLMNEEIFLLIKEKKDGM